MRLDGASQIFIVVFIQLSIIINSLDEVSSNSGGLVYNALFYQCMVGLCYPREISVMFTDRRTDVGTRNPQENQLLGRGAGDILNS
jgi:hypothetical protein